MRVVVCGSRDYGNVQEKYEYVLSVLDRLSQEWPEDVTIISGMARGVDTAAADWAISQRVIDVWVAPEPTPPRAGAGEVYRYDEDGFGLGVPVCDEERKAA